MATNTADAEVTVNESGSWVLPRLPAGPLQGRYLTVRVPPGLQAPVHHHQGVQFIYVLEGTVTSQMEGEPVAEYGPGDVWYEALDQRHLIFANRGDQPATVLVFFLSTAAAPVLTFD